VEAGEDEDVGSDDSINEAVREPPQDCAASVPMDQGKRQGATPDQLQHRPGSLKKLIAESDTLPLVPSVCLIEISGSGGAEEDTIQ
jgi:hypothetical protein